MTPPTTGRTPSTYGLGIPAVAAVPALQQRILDALGPAVQAAAGPLLPPLLAALTSQLLEVDDLTRSEDGIAALWDLDVSPRPGWLGQGVGVAYDRTLSAEQQRARVRSRGQTRGNPDAIIAAATAVLSTSDGAGGVTDRRVLLLERVHLAAAVAGDYGPRSTLPAPYRFVVRVYAAQVGVGTTSKVEQLRAAIAAVKPVGLLFEVDVVSGWTYDDARSTGGTYAQESGSGVTYTQDTATVPTAAGLARYRDDYARGWTYANDSRTSYDRNLAADTSSGAAGS